MQCVALRSIESTWQREVVPFEARGARTALLCAITSGAASCAVQHADAGAACGRSETAVAALPDLLICAAMNQRRMAGSPVREHRVADIAAVRVDVVHARDR